MPAVISRLVVPSFIPSVRTRSFLWRLPRGPDRRTRRSPCACVCVRVRERAIMRHLPRCVFRRDSFGDKWRLADARTIAPCWSILIPSWILQRTLSDYERQFSLGTTLFRGQSAQIAYKIAISVTHVIVI